VSPPPAKTIGRYEVAGLLAEGGMAEILLGRLVGPSGFEYPVVIKRILPSLARSPELATMFVDEATIVAAIRHPNVAAVHELGRDAYELFMVLEYLEGENVGGLMRRLWSRGQSIGYRLAAYVAAEVCAGLHAAHELCDDDGAPRDVVHRDVSPQNVFVTYRGEVKILDFGIAKAAQRQTKTDAGLLKGKYGYMSPEQCHGKPLDRRSDLFSLATVLYELSVGRRLFQRESDLATLKAITEESAPPPSRLLSDYPPELERIVMRALARKRQDRYPSAAEMRRDLLLLVHALPSDSLPEEELGRLMRQLFSDRMAAKSALLSRLRTTSEVAAIPEAEVDETIEIPILEGETATATRATFAARERGPGERSSGWRRPVVAIAAIALAAVAASLLLDRDDASDAGASAAPPAVEPAPSAPQDEPVIPHVASSPSAPAPSATTSAAPPRTWPKAPPRAAPPRAAPPTPAQPTTSASNYTKI
jgi:serine/threonine-protein kinase